MVDEPSEAPGEGSPEPQPAPAPEPSGGEEREQPAPSTPSEPEQPPPAGPDDRPVGVDRDHGEPDGVPPVAGSGDPTSPEPRSDGDREAAGRKPTTFDSDLLGTYKDDTAVRAGRDDQPETDDTWVGETAADRAERNQSRERFGFGRIDSDGPLAIGDYAVAVTVQTSDGRRVIVLRYTLTDADLDNLRRWYVEVERYPVMEATLRRHQLLFLSGADGSGRRTTAHFLLARLRAEGLVDDVVGLDFDSDLTPAQLYERRAAFTEHSGIVLELRGDATVRTSTLDAFRTLSRDIRGYLVILGLPATVDGEGTNELVVAHDGPDPRKVLERHLRAKWPANLPTGRIYEAFDDPSLADHLARHRRPRHVVELAAALLRGLPHDEPLETLLGRLRPDSRQTAREALEDAVRAEASPTDPFAGPRRLALRIAYAIFDGLPLADVLDAAELLLSLLRTAEAPDSTPARRVFNDPVDSLLFKDMATNPEASPQAAPETPRRARLIDPALTDAVLDVAWNDYDTTRTALLIWLDQLAVRARFEMRVRSAAAVGKLATYDFERVTADLIRPWAIDFNGARRQAAAWALELVARDPRFTARVRGRVRDWVFGRDAEARDTAARAYATELGVSAPEIAIFDLRTVAEDPAQRPRRSVARAVAEIYRPESATVVMDELATWLESDSVHVAVQATWALLPMAQRRAQPPRQRWPMLLDQCLGERSQWQVLTGLWVAALAEATTAYAAWEQLRQWCELPGDDGELEGAVYELVRAVFADPRLARRAKWHVRLWRGRNPKNPLYGRLHEVLGEG